MNNIILALLAFSTKLGYWGIFFLMTIESSFIPFPSEIVVPPAAYLAHQGEMNIYLVIIAGIFGSLLGASINYFLALTLGRKIVYSLAETKIASMLLVSRKKIEHAEKYFLKYGEVSTFIGRLVPVVRQLISIPAGLAKMNFGKFIFYTFLGSSSWIIILAVLGYSFGANQEKISHFSSDFGYYFIVLAILIIIFLIWRNKKAKKSKATNAHAG